jgi:hypothetical protein
MLERPGDYLLPAIAIRWWNVRTERIETARVDTIKLHVLNNPASHLAPGKPQSRWNSLGFVDFVSEHWIMLLLVLGAGLALPRLNSRVLAVIAPRWRQRRDSEPWAFICLLGAACRPRADYLYAALLNWLGRFDPIDPDRTLKPRAGKPLPPCRHGSIPAPGARRRATPAGQLLAKKPGLVAGTGGTPFARIDRARATAALSIAAGRITAARVNHVGKRIGSRAATRKERRPAQCRGRAEHETLNLTYFVWNTSMSYFRSSGLEPATLENINARPDAGAIATDIFTRRASPRTLADGATATACPVGN